MGIDQDDIFIGTMVNIKHYKLIVAILFVFSVLFLASPHFVRAEDDNGGGQQSGQEKSTGDNTQAGTGDGQGGPENVQPDDGQTGAGSEEPAGNTEQPGGEAGGDPNLADSVDIEEVDVSVDIHPKRAELYETYALLLKNFVDEEGNVNYGELRRKRVELISVCNLLEDIHPVEFLSWSKKQKIAFWINAYNIFTIRLIIDHYPIQPKWYNKFFYPDNSIIHIPGAWSKFYFNVLGLEYSLEEIKKEQLMQKFGDPRSIFALGLGTMGGPFLRGEPYRGSELDEQLDQQVRRFLESGRGMKIDAAAGTIILSDIFNQHEDAFKKYADIKRFREKPEKVRSYLNFIYEFVDAQTAQNLEKGNFEVDFKRYDWLLNETSVN